MPDLAAASDTAAPLDLTDDTAAPPGQQEAPGAEEPSGTQQAWQSHVLERLDGLGEQLLNLSRMPGQLDKVSELVAGLNARFDRVAPAEVDPASAMCRLSQNSGCDLERHVLAKDAAFKLQHTFSLGEVALHQPLHQPLIGGGGLQRERDSNGPDHRNSGTSLKAGMGPMGMPCHGATLHSRMGSRIPSAVPSRVQSQLQSRRCSIMGASPDLGMHSKAMNDLARRMNGGDRGQSSGSTLGMPNNGSTHGMVTGGNGLGPGAHGSGSVLGVLPGLPATPAVTKSYSGGRKQMGHQKSDPEQAPPPVQETAPPILGLGSLPGIGSFGSLQELQEQQELERSSAVSSKSSESIEDAGEGSAPTGNFEITGQFGKGKRTTYESQTTSFTSIPERISTEGLSVHGPKPKMKTQMSLRLSSGNRPSVAPHPRVTVTRMKIAGSMELDREAFEENSPVFILMPNSCGRMFFDCLTIMAIMCTGIAVPISIAYLDLEFPDDSAFGLLLHTSDLLWLVYIAVNFATAFYASGEWVLQPPRIALAYLRSWLLLDLLAACPIITLGMLRSNSKRLLGTFLALKMLRVLRLNMLLTKLQKWYRHTGIMVAKVGIMFALLVNMLACCWRLAQLADEQGSWFRSMVGVHYVRDLYWLMMTFTTVGYGDITPQGTAGRIFAIMAMLFAPAFFGGIVSLLNHGVKKIFNDEVELKVAQAVHFMQKRRVHRHLQRRVEQNFRHQIGKEHAMTVAPDLFKNLSPAVQRELSLELLRTTVLEFPLFYNGPRPFVAEIAQAHSWVQCLPWDLVVEQGQLLQEIVFLIQGRIIMQCFTQECQFDARPIDASQEEFFEEELVEEQELEVGAWFGEKCLFEDDRVRTATGLAAIDSELAVLHNSEFHRILTKYPPLLEMHGALQKGLSNGHLSYDELEYRRPPPPSSSLRRSHSSIFKRSPPKKVVPHT